MAKTVRPFLMFQEGNAEEAMRLYVSLFEGGEVVNVARHPDGKVALGTFTIAGQTVLCTDSPIKHEFTFTPSSSLFVECTSEDELRRLAGELGARTLMPVGSYGFSTLFAWVNDRFGVSWQLNLA
jgi:predicted 3-demethylubiquinone-9 3-methyltransferase (glyoxalase superfamily)